MTIRQMKLQARQGDVYIINEKDVKLRLETKERLFSPKFELKANFALQGNRLPLAFGEVTGHAHAIYKQDVAELTYSKDIQETLKHLKVTTSAVLEHEEHAPIEIPVGNNVILIQKEYQLKIGRVAD